MMSNNNHGNSNGADAVAQESEASMMMIQLAVSILLQDFYDANSPQDVLASGKILATLLRNAALTSNDNPKHGTIRLVNPKIQKHVVNVYGALDILERAGFVRAASSGDHMTYISPTVAVADVGGEHDSLLQQKQEERRVLVEAICSGLETKIAELKLAPSPAVVAPASANKSSASASATSASKPKASNDNSEFLGDKQRLERIQKLKAQKKAKNAQREAAKERWKEDMEDRRMAAQRHQSSQAVGVAARSVPVGDVGNNNASSSKSSVNLNLPKPFEDSASTAAAAPCSKSRLLEDPESVRRELIQRYVKDPALSPTEKQSKIQELMRMEPEAVFAAANAAETDSMLEEDDNDDNVMKMAVDDADAKPASIMTAESGMQKSDDENKKEQKQPAAAVTSQKAPPSPTVSLQPNNRKPSLASRVPSPPSAEWTQFIQRVPRCASAEGIRDTSAYYKHQSSSNASSSNFDTSAVPNAKCLKRLFKEFDTLEDDLPSDPNCSIWLRFDEETPQYIRALITAPLPGPTPYSGGIFAFDMFVPNDYPRTNPKIRLLTTGGGRVRFGPNLYADGKVCLSLLGTWEGPKWNPQHSSLYQLLISIQGLILGVEHPYYLEPGHGGWEGKVKEGDFQVEGRTLAGRKVNFEAGVPSQVVLYEDVLRVGAVKYAMAQPLRMALETTPSHKGNASNISNNNVLEAFGDIVRAHFCENRTEILTEVQGWMDDLALGRKREAAPSIGNVATAKKGMVANKLQIDELKILLPKLEELFGRALVPVKSDSGSLEHAAAKEVDESNTSSMDVEEDSKPPAQMTEEVKKQPPEPSSKQNAAVSDVDILDQKRQQMQDASGSGDFILAGKIQEEVKRLEDLQRGIQEAAQQNDFIRAGRLQAQFKALTQNATETIVPNNNANANQQSASVWNDEEDDDSNNSDEDPLFSDEDHHGGDDMNWNSDEMNMGNSDGYHSNMPSRYHSWGAGHTLAAPPAAHAPSPAMESSTKKATAAAATSPKKAIPSDQLCRLRIRLPQDKSVVEEFDKNDSLAAVYHRLEPLVPDDYTNGKQCAPTAAAAGPLVPGGAFSQPFSVAGFTLLLARPKREFNLEMHGTKSLAELNLAPSATLTVMKCSERGVMYRGEVESRLRAAQGDAMDVEGLTYEGLMELTERVGKAAPKEGSAFLNMTVEEYEANTKKISPAAYLDQLDRSMEEHGEEDRRCPICLGCYDDSDNTPSLRKVKNCGHTMHAGCLQTWLMTNSSCPLCKAHIVADGKGQL